MKELIKKLFTKKKPSQTQETEYKSLNAATILVNIMLEQNNVSSDNPIKQPQMVIDSWEKETKYKSLNAAILTDIINQSNISGNTESNNNNNK